MTATSNTAPATPAVPNLSPNKSAASNVAVRGPKRETMITGSCVEKTGRVRRTAATVNVIVAGGHGKHSAVVPNCAFSRAVSTAIP